MAATTAGVGRLEEEALRRKERLKALREKTGRKVRNAKEGPWLRKPAFAPGTGNDRAGNYEEKAAARTRMCSRSVPAHEICC